MSEALSKFGSIVVMGGRDEGLRVADSILDGSAKPPMRRNLAEALSHLSDVDREHVRAVVRAGVDAAIHGLLFNLTSDDGIEISVDGVKLTEESDGLHGDYVTELGWIGMFSAYPE
jgi:hypothetical protein